MRRIADMTYWASYFVGIPVLLLAQVVGIVSAFLGKPRAALWIPTIAIGLFVLLASAASVLIATLP